MEPGERVEIKRQVAEELGKRPWHEIDLILSEFNQATSDTWGGNDEVAYVIDMMFQATDRDLRALADYVLSASDEPLPAGAGPWQEGRFKLFLSHLYDERDWVAALKKAVSWQGVDCFVAHADIHPSNRLSRNAIGMQVHAE